MIELSSVLWGMILFFAVIGYLRGWTKEIIALTGVILALFSIEQLRGGILSPFTSGAGHEQQFYLYSGLLLIITIFAYHTPRRFAKKTAKRRNNRDSLQEGLLGAVIGGFNAYLVFGTLWYYMFELAYPLSPYVVAPAANSPSVVMETQLPLTWLLDGNLLTLILVVLFLFVIVALI